MAHRPPRGDYEVGYGRPPRHSRFRPGRSGNPKGRPKGSADVGASLAKALGERVAVKAGGRRRTMTKAEAITTQLVNRAAGADLRAIGLLLALERERRTGRGAAGAAAGPAEGREAPGADPAAEELDVESLTTEQLGVLLELVDILDARRVRPPIPMPPGDPGRRGDDT